MSTAEKLLTAEEFFHLPEPIEGGKMELVDGKVVTMSPVGLQHGEVAAEICDALRAFARPRGLGTVTQETGFRLRRNPDLVRAPDVSFLRADRTPPRGSRASFVEGYPDLAVEVLSPEDRMADVLRKVAEYLEAGTPRVWVADPSAASVAVYRPGGMRTLGTGETVTSDEAGFEAEGFSLPVPAIFES